MIIFSTTSNLRVLAQSSWAFMDGTFKATPRIYTQLYSIHGLYREHFVPLVYALLSDKQRSTYHELFDIVKRELAELDLVWDSDRIMSDFEPGLIPCVRHHFPRTTHKGCHFHFCQAIWKNVQHNGLQGLFNSEPIISNVVRKLQALSFLPVISIRPAFEQLKNSPGLDAFPATDALFNYFENTWLKGNYPVKMWCVHNETIRTNNRIEGWHSRMNKGLRHHHPNIYILTSYLRREQAVMELTLQRARLGGAPKSQRRKYRELDQRLTRIREGFRQGDSTVEEFLDSLMHIVHRF